MMMRRAYAALLVCFLLPLTVAAQRPPAELSLAEAVALARQHNPEYRSQLGDASVADWGVRSAYAAFLPTASVGGGMSYQGKGQMRLGSFTGGDIGLGETPSYYFSSYSLSMQLGLDGSTFYRIGQERANRSAVLARLDAAEQVLRSNVTQHYLAVLRAQDAVALAEAELERAEANLRLAEGRHAVETATLLEVRQAEVERGRAQVELLRQESALETERLRLLQVIGLDLDGEVELTTEVRVFEPVWEADEMIGLAMGGQPHLEAARARAAAARAEVGVARSAYWPRLLVSSSLTGYTRRVGSDRFLLDQAERQMLDARDQCVAFNELLSRLNPPMEPLDDCTQFAFTPELQSSILESNRQFPWNFDREPLSVSVGLSVPIFQGLNRRRQVEAANVAEDAARLQVRGEELRVQAEVRASLGTLRSAYEAVRLEERNRELADDQLRLARERYELGAASFMELLDAETMKARADRSHLLGVYAFQEALTALEAAVGHELATPRD
jgi:outer membrane protein